MKSKGISQKGVLSMGQFVNPGNESFVRVVKADIYVDKTGLIKELNRVLATEQCFICVSRARRFGKSVTAGMIKAYYSKGCNSKALFAGLEIENADDYYEHLNKYDLIHIDMSSVWTDVNGNSSKLMKHLKTILINELKNEYNCVDISDCISLKSALAKINYELGIKFVFIIDEWDTVFRECKEDEAVQIEYITMLRGLFKSEEAKQYTALAYITGILPIKKYGIESALNNFTEYTMVSPKNLAKYYGFTDGEVKELCKQYNMDYEIMKQWYDGYSFKKEAHIYNPNSVVKAILLDSYESYWSNTETFNSLQGYISLNFEGLRDDIIRMFSGERCRVMPGSFANDFVSYKSKDDVLTALIHLGYLAYDFDMKEAYIPNAEVQEAFEYAIKGTDWKELVQSINYSEQLMKMTWKGNTEAVAEALGKIHGETTSILQYNDEDSLSCAVNMAYYNARIYYTVVREMPTGKGFADFVFIPKSNIDKPAMIIELKYNKSAQTAITQIKEKQYIEGLKAYENNLLLVGINYDKETKKHSCIIERY